MVCCTYALLSVALAWQTTNHRMQQASPCSKSVCDRPSHPRRAADLLPQCLWRCADFRGEVLSWGPGVYRKDAVLQVSSPGCLCIVCAVLLAWRHQAPAGGAAAQRRDRSWRRQPSAVPLQ